MSRRWILPFVALVVLVSPGRSVPEAKPPAAGPRLVSVMEADWPGMGCTGHFAVDDRGTVYASCGHTAPFQVVGTVPGVPVSLGKGVGIVIVGTEDGSVWVTNPGAVLPWTFTRQNGVFGG